MIVIASDDKLERVIATVPAGTRWTTFTNAVLTAIENAPAFVRYNGIIDDQGPMDDVDVPGVSRVGEAFRRLAGGSERPTFTIVVTTDRFFETWARVIDRHHGARRHLAAPSLDGAVSLLDRLEDRS
ncbi:hypothetical protein [Brevundimonas sp.]|uniref:hypothetical protein n=1 Tax=Brevundimonas sp. TaxID=1871086 RepID=UPI002FC89B66